MNTAYHRLTSLAPPIQRGEVAGGEEALPDRATQVPQDVKAVGFLGEFDATPRIGRPTYSCNQVPVYPCRTSATCVPGTHSHYYAGPGIYLARSELLPLVAGFRLGPRCRVRGSRVWIGTTARRRRLARFQLLNPFPGGQVIGTAPREALCAHNALLTPRAPGRSSRMRLSASCPQLPLGRSN